MIVQFFKPFLLQTDQGLEHFDVDDRADVPQYVARQLQEGGWVKMTDALRIGDRVKAVKVCPKDLRSPDYEEPAMVNGRIIEIDHDRMMVKIESLCSDNFLAPMAHVRKI